MVVVVVVVVMVVVVDGMQQGNRTAEHERQ